MAHLFLEDFVESIQELPREARAKLEDIREKDLQYNEQRKNVSRRISSFIKATKSQGKLDGSEHVPTKIRAEYNKALELIHAKISEDTAAYDMLDRHIKRLDHDLKQFELEMEEEKQKLERAGLDNDKRVLKRKVAADESSQKLQKKRSKFDTDVEANADGPVDPNEPLYCICQQISFGEMIACDNTSSSRNPGCVYEWFHYPCVGLTVQPKGKWYCSECLCKMKKLIP